MFVICDDGYVMRDKNIYFNWIAKRIKVEGSKILDVGCNPGTFSSKLINMGHFVTGVDLKHLDMISERFKFTRGDILEVEFETCSFDYVVACHVLQHIGLGYQDIMPHYICLKGDRFFAEKAYLWLRPGGSLFIVVPIANRFQYMDWSPTYSWRVYDFDTIMDIFGGRFKIVDKMTFDGAYDTKTKVSDTQAIVIEAKKI